MAIIREQERITQDHHKQAQWSHFGHDDAIKGYHAGDIVDNPWFNAILEIML